METELPGVLRRKAERASPFRASSVSFLTVIEMCTKYI